MRARNLIFALLVGGSALALVEVGCGTNQRGPIPAPGPDGGSIGGPPGSYDGGLVPNDGGFQDAPGIHLDSGPGQGGDAGF